MDLKKILYVNANVNQIAMMTNAALKQSKKMTNAAFSSKLLTIKKPKFGKDVVKDLYQTSHCYDKKGNVTEAGKNFLEKYLEEAGLPKNATLYDVMKAMIKKYR